ncbi:hydrogenase iron-sulfur subunit [Chloroflexota bacterium]
MKEKTAQQKILALATSQCAYPGADAVGQSHIEYPSNVYILEVVDPVMFPDEFYLSCFQKGIGGIIIMSCGDESPYKGAFEKTAERIQRVHNRMKEIGWDSRRLRLTSICTVCIKPFLKEVNDMNNLLQELGPLKL